MRRLSATPVLAALIALLAGCGGPSQADRIATEVAAGIAATQAIERQVATAVAATAAAGAASVTPAPTEAVASATPAPAEPAATATTSPTDPPAATQAPSETPAATPTSTPAELIPLPTDTPSPTPPPVAAVFPIGGSTQGVEGAVLVPGYSQPPVPPEPFRDSLAFRVAVRDPAAGEADGDGIERVEFRVQQVDPDGNITEVYERVEMSAPYCMFSGDDPACNPIDLVQGAAFPNGAPLVSGQYHVEIAIFALDPEKNAFWNFDFLVELR